MADPNSGLDVGGKREAANYLVATDDLRKTHANRAVAPTESLTCSFTPAKAGTTSVRARIAAIVAIIRFMHLLIAYLRKPANHFGRADDGPPFALPFAVPS